MAYVSLTSSRMLWRLLRPPHRRARPRRIRSRSLVLLERA